MTTDSTRPTPYSSDGAARPGAARPPLRRPQDRILGGVCAAVADHLGIDATLVRLAALALAVVTGGVALLAYLVGWLVIPPADGPAAPVVRAPLDIPAPREAWRAVGTDLRSLGEALRVAPQEPRSDRGRLAGVDATLTGLGDRLRDPQVQARARLAADRVSTALDASLDGITRRDRRS